jgi:hypothetical protein
LLAFVVVTDSFTWIRRPRLASPTLTTKVESRHPRRYYGLHPTLPPLARYRVRRWSLGSGLVAAFRTEPPTRYAATNAQFGWPIDLGDSTLKAESVRKELGRIVVGCVVVGLLASCSQRTSEGVANTAPIPTEPIVSTRPPAPQPTEPPTTTTLPGSPLQASDIPPVPILVRYKPQNADEEELLVAAQDLLPKLYPLLFDRRFVVEEHERAFTSESALEWIEQQRVSSADGIEIVPGPDSRFVLEEVLRIDATTGSLQYCEYDTATSFKRDEAGRSVLAPNGDRKSSARYDLSLVVTERGWRIDDFEQVEFFPGEDICAS